MVDFTLSDVFIQPTISTVTSSLQLCDVTLPEAIVSRASWQRWENCGTSFVAQQEPTCERETSRPLLGAQSPLQTDGTTERTSFVPLRIFLSYGRQHMLSEFSSQQSLGTGGSRWDFAFHIWILRPVTGSKTQAGHPFKACGLVFQEKSSSHRNTQVAHFTSILWLINHQQS